MFDNDKIFNLNKISLKQFFELDENLALRYLAVQSLMKDKNGDLKSKNVFCKRKSVKLGELSFGKVSELKRLIQEDTHYSVIGVLQTVFRVKENEALNADIISFFYAANHISKEVLSLIKKEYNALKHEQDPDLEMAGIKKLSIFGELSTLIGIAERYGNTPMEVEDWKYNMVFSLMLHDKVTKEIQKNYNEIKSNGPKGMV